VYYQLLNEGVRARLGGLHSADLILRSYDFSLIQQLQATDDWTAAADVLAGTARELEQAGADCVLICTNTMHKVAPAVQEAVQIPLLHIVDATADAIKTAGAQRPLLLATRYTMEQPFYRDRLSGQHGIDVIVPDADDRETIHSVIFEELCQGVADSDSRDRFLEIVNKAREERGTDSIILGCTEIGLLVDEAMLSQPTFDTTKLHVDAALDFSLT
jgi:aspartate racemase